MESGHSSGYGGGGGIGYFNQNILNPL